MRQAIVCLVAAVLLVAAGPARGEDYSIDSFFDVFTEFSHTEGPPFPSDPPIRIASRGGGMYLEDIVLQFFEPGSEPFDNPVADASDSGGSQGDDWGKTATLLIGSPNGNFNVDSFFDIIYRIEFDGSERAIEGVSLPSGDFAVDSFFDITYQIEFSDGTQETRGVRGTLTPMQPAVTGISGEVVPSSDFAADSFFDITYQIDFGTVPIDPGLPLLRIDLEGGHTPEPGSLTLLVAGGLMLLACTRRRRRRD